MNKRLMLLREEEIHVARVGDTVRLSDGTIVGTIIKADLGWGGSAIQDRDRTLTSLHVPGTSSGSISVSNVILNEDAFRRLFDGVEGVSNVSATQDPNDPTRYIVNATLAPYYRLDYLHTSMSMGCRVESEPCSICGASETNGCLHISRERPPDDP